MARPARALAALVWLAGAAGCASLEPLSASLPVDVPARVELTDTPFFPQEDYQCGPASLAAVLVARGVAVSPDELVREVYLPALRGSLQAELLGAVRRRGLLPYVLPNDRPALFEQVAAGSPVLVLLNLGVEALPVWHYAVVVGFDGQRDAVILRSGRAARATMSWSRFDRSWRLAGRWAVIVLSPDTMPVRPIAINYVEACAGLEAARQFAAASACYAAAARRWPQEALVPLGVGNVAYRQGDFFAAAAAYSHAVKLSPKNGVARNNFAQALLDAGCGEAALAQARHALELLRGTPLEQAARDTLLMIEEAPAAHDGDACRRLAEDP